MTACASRSLLSLAAALLAACGPATPPPAAPATCNPSSQAVASAPLALIAANNRGDVESALGGYTEDAVWLPPGRAPMQGRSTFRERYETLFRTHAMRLTAEIAEARADGSLGFARGRIQGTRNPLDGGLPQPVDDVFLAVTRCEQGRWRVSHLMWSNAPEPGAND
jgi:uncharacterized protein (TIGR02246 family)